MPIPSEMRYQFVTGQIKYHNEKIIESFNLFIRLFTGIVVAAVWLSTQPDPFNRHSLYAFLALVLVAMLATMTIITVIANVMAWYGYRHAETGLVGADRVKPPTIPGFMLERDWYSCLYHRVQRLVLYLQPVGTIDVIR